MEILTEHQTSKENPAFVLIADNDGNTIYSLPIADNTYIAIPKELVADEWSDGSSEQIYKLKCPSVSLLIK